jgi:cytochrome c peroxidase
MRLVPLVVFLVVTAGAFADDPPPYRALPAVAPAPANNPTTPEKVELGKQLYFDTRLSLTQTVSCNSCHNVAAGGDDHRSVSVGINGLTGTRNAPTVWNSAFNSVQFWDGRATDLEAQAKGPLTNPVEMGMPSYKAVVDRIEAVPDYVTSFKTAFGDGPITIDRVAQAIGAYERTLITPNGPFDRYLAGDKSAISPQAERGLELATTLNCFKCHSGANFSGADTGPGAGEYARFPSPRQMNDPYVAKYKLAEDMGRYAATGVDDDKHKFRIASLRNVAITAPYFHNGSVATLDEAVRVMAKLAFGKVLTNAQASDLVAFLETLTGELPAQEPPVIPR